MLAQLEVNMSLFSRWFGREKSAKQGTTGSGEHPRERANSDDVPTMMVVGIQGPFVLDQVLALARQNDKELIVMGNRSPAFRDTTLLRREAVRFRNDPGVVLVFEKRPNAQDPFCMDPLVIVRRSFFLEVARSVAAETLGELAILLAREASRRKLTVGYL